MPEGKTQEEIAAEAAAEKARQEAVGLEKLDAETREFVLGLRKENEKLRKKYEAELKKEEDKQREILAKQGEYKTLYETLKAQYDPLKERIAKFEAAEAARKKVLLAKLPESKREEFAGVETEVLESMVELLAKQTTTRGTKAGDGKEQKKLSQMTAEEQSEFRQTNPVAWREQYTNEYRAKYGCDPPASMTR